MQQQVPEGYKRTYVGVIPDEWNTPMLGSVCGLVNGRGFKPFEWSEHGLPIIRIQNLNGSDEFNYYEGLFDPKIFIEHGQLLFAWSGSRGTSFGPHIWEGGNALLNYHTWKMVIDTTKIESDFFYHALKSLTKQIEDSAHGASALVHTQKGEMEKLLIPVPSNKKEQTAIANALSDVDALITSIEKLITKKRAIKTAAMQQLLTGKKRLPPFDQTHTGYKQTELGEIPEDWEVKTVFRIAGEAKSQFEDGDWVEAEHITDRGVRLIQTGNIGIGEFVEKENRKYIYEESFAKLRCKELIAGDLLICRLAEPAGRACIFPKLDEYKVITSVDVTICRPKETEVSREYLMHYFTTSQWFRSVSDHVGGTTHKRISRGALGKLLVPLASLDEQVVIANVLSDMDKDIVQLEMRLKKTTQLKQGMMQELLSGRTRLI